MKKPASVFVPIILGTIILMAFSPTVAAISSAATVKIIGKDTVKIGQKVFSTFHFSPDTIKIVSRGTVTFENIATEEPHTISLVTESELPTASNIFMCGAPGTICNVIFLAHIPFGFDANGNPVVVRQFVDLTTTQGFSFPSGFTNSTGFAGNSIILPPNNVPFPHTYTVTISAPSGATLHFMCAIHPWMQGTIEVE